MSFERRGKNGPEYYIICHSFLKVTQFLTSDSSVVQEVTGFLVVVVLLKRVI